MRRIVTADIGGTHARFAIASVENGRVTGLAEPVTLKTGDYSSLEAAWEELGRRTGELPNQLAIAFAGEMGGDELSLTNSSWVVRPLLLREQLGLERLSILNDFGAVAHAVANLGVEHFRGLCGPAEPLPTEGLITIVGPGTGLGVAALLRRSDGSYEVIETEGGHGDFAPLDSIEDRILHRLREKFGRVSVERLVSGPGLSNIYEALAAIEDCPANISDEKQLWTVAMERSDSLAAAALDRLCLTLGAVAGDLALIQGAVGVVVAGGLGLRLAEHLPRRGFGERFASKGRRQDRMAKMPVKLLTHPQPGLFGAAAAFAREYA